MAKSNYSVVHKPEHPPTHPSIHPSRAQSKSTARANTLKHGHDRRAAGRLPGPPSTIPPPPGETWQSYSGSFEGQ